MFMKRLFSLSTRKIEMRLKALDSLFKSKLFNDQHIAEYLNLFPSSSRMKLKSISFGINDSLYLKYSKIYSHKTIHGHPNNIKRIKEKLLNNQEIESVILPDFFHFITIDAPETAGALDELKELVELRSPANWFPEARKTKRKFILHCGPTNSGKTYHALQALTKSKTGIYCAPLRLLAHEIYSKLNTESIPCNLITGEEKKITANIHKYSCTVEMALLEKEFEVAIIDEIQMISDPQRGFAWTNALFGLRASEIHLCGDLSSPALVKKLVAYTGDSLEIKKYERLSPLSLDSKKMTSLSHVKKGDCVISFSRTDIFSIKKIIESSTSHKCALIYGNLPPEIRAEQAKLFNSDKSQYNILVASDAIGMGLNLNINRIIFDTVDKIDGPIPISQIKQISGRAGRFRAGVNDLSNIGGKVTAFDGRDFRYIKQSLNSPTQPLLRAGLLPLYPQIKQLHLKFPDQNMIELLEKFELMSILEGLFFLCKLDDQKRNAQLIQDIKLSLKDRYHFVLAPVNKSPILISALTKIAKVKSIGSSILITEIITLPLQCPQNKDSLYELENYHKTILLYLWLAQRMPETCIDSLTAVIMKKNVELMIQKALLTIKFERKKNSFKKY